MATENIDLGTLVYAPVYKRGQVTRRCKGIVLGRFGGNWLVWFYRLGPACPGSTVQALSPSMLRPLREQIADLSEATLTQIERGFRTLPSVEKSVGWKVGEMRVKKRAARLGR